MSLKVQVSRHLDVTVMELSGRVTLGEGAASYRGCVIDAIWNGHKKLALDYGDISYQDSSGNGEMVSAFTLVSNSGGDLVVFDLTKRIKDLLQITKLYTVFQVFETLEAVLAYFDSKRKPDVTVSERRYAHVSVLEVGGSVAETSGAAKIRAGVHDALRAGMQSIVILCPQITDIDATGAKYILDACNDVRRAGGELLLAGVEDRLRPRLQAAGLPGDVRIVEPLDSALEALGLIVGRSGWTIKVSRAT